ncbi:MAG: hypothetical protein ABSG92_09965, partial [Conexivisphaerales archaeon]
MLALSVLVVAILLASMATMVYSSSNPGSPVLTISNSIAEPSAVTFDKSGNLWVADAQTGEVFEFTPPYTGAPALTISNSLAEPFDVTFDSSGNLWVAD